MPLPSNLVHQTSTSSGSGNLTLVAVNGRQTFNGAFGNGSTQNVFDYFVSSQGFAEWEYGTGHMSNSTTLVRDTVILSSNSNAAVNFSASTLDVTNDVPASRQDAAQGTALLDFGAFPGNVIASIDITGQATIVSGSTLNAWVFPNQATADHTVGEQIADPIIVMATDIVAGTGFTIYGIALPGTGQRYGKYNVAWSWR